MTDCYVDEQGCTVCPEIESVPDEPARVDYLDRPGWNAGANSIATRSNARVRYAFTAEQANGFVSGVSRSRRVDVTSPSNIDFGFYLLATGGLKRYVVVERGVEKTALSAYDPAHVFSITRWDGRIYYAVNDELVYISEEDYFGQLTAGVAFYATGDIIADPVFEIATSLPKSTAVWTVDLVVHGPTLSALGAALEVPSATLVGALISKGVLTPPVATISTLGAVLVPPSVSVYSVPNPTTVPQFVLADLVVPHPQIVLSSSVRSVSSVDITMPSATVHGAVANFGILTAPAIAIEGPYPAGRAYAIISQSPGYLSMWAGFPLAVAEDAINFASAASSQLAVVIRSALQLRDSAAIIQRLGVSISSSLQLTDTVRNLFELFIASDLALADQTTNAYSALAAIADSIAFDPGASATVSGDAIVASVLALNDMLRAGFDVRVVSDIEMADAFTALATHYVEALDSVTFGDEATTGASLTVLVQSPLTLGDVITSTGAFNVTALSELAFTVRVKVDGDEYIGYAMNLKNAAVSEYENFPMTSMVEFDGRYFGTAADGVYELEGDDDAGENIDMLVRTALSDLGSSYLKKVLNSYIGYTATGDVVLKVITTHKGEKRESWYKFASRTPEATSNTRATIAKGIDSVYWQFELVNVAGADMSLEAIKLWPFPLTRRYTGK